MNLKKCENILLLSAVLGIFCCSLAPGPGEVPKNLTWPKPPDIPRIRWINSFSTSRELGIKVSLLGKLHKLVTGKKKEEVRIISPYNLFLSEDGTIYITDTFSRSVHVFDRHSNKYWEIFNIKDGSLLSPIGIAVQSEGKIFISDSILNKVFVFNKKGNPLFTIESEDFHRPTGITIDNDLERLYVVDTLAHDVKVFGLTGEKKFSFGSRGRDPGEFNFPTCIWVDKKHRVYIGDSMNFRIQVFDSEGNYLSGFGNVGDGTGYFSKLKGIAVDSDGHIYATDAQFDVVQIFDHKGNYLLSFGHSGQDFGEFSFPAGIFIDKMDNIYVVDKLNQRVQVFEYLKEEK